MALFDYSAGRRLLFARGKGHHPSMNFGLLTAILPWQVLWALNTGLGLRKLMTIWGAWYCNGYDVKVQYGEQLDYSPLSTLMIAKYHCAWCTFTSRFLAPFVPHRSAVSTGLGCSTSHIHRPNHQFFILQVLSHFVVTRTSLSFNEFKWLFHSSSSIRLIM